MSSPKYCLVRVVQAVQKVEQYQRLSKVLFWENSRLFNWVSLSAYNWPFHYGFEKVYEEKIIWKSLQILFKDFLQHSKCFVDKRRALFVQRLAQKRSPFVTWNPLASIVWNEDSNWGSKFGQRVFFPKFGQKFGLTSFY